MNANLNISNCTFSSINGQIIKAEPDKESRTDIPLLVNISNSFITDNFGTPDALIVATTNSYVFANNSNFEDNFSLGRGSVAFAEQT
jgi:hypothetical protein